MIVPPNATGIAQPRDDNLEDFFPGAHTRLIELESENRALNVRVESLEKELQRAERVKIAAELVILPLAKLRAYFGNSAREIVIQKFQALNRNVSAAIEVRDLTAGLDWIRNHGSDDAQAALRAAEHGV